MKLVQFYRTVTRAFTGYALITNKDPLKDVKLDVDDWCSEVLDEHDYKEIIDLSLGGVRDLSDAEERAWFEEDVFNQRQGNVLVMRDEDGIFTEDVDEDLVESLLDKAREDREYQEFMRNQLKLTGV